MIPVAPAPEPAGFDEQVRKPGLAALAKLAEDYGSPNAIPASKFPPLWTHSLDDLLEGYNRLCSYVCLYIPRITGARSVDHMVPKSNAWQQAYEWSNYRLACALMNARKHIASDVLDPFEVQRGWFALEGVFFQVLPGSGLPAETAEAVDDTIVRLRLNDQQCREARAEYAQDYWDRRFTLDHLTRHAPFVAQELRRLGLLHEDDV